MRFPTVARILRRHDALDAGRRAGGAGGAPGIRAFRAKYPGHENYVVCADVERPFRTRASGVEVTVTGLEGLVAGLSADLLP